MVVVKIENSFIRHTILLWDSSIHTFIHYLSLTSPLWLTAPEPYRATACGERELTLVHIHTFLTKKVMEGFPRWEISSMPGPTTETTQTWKPINIIHALIHSNKANTKGWLWRPNDIHGPCGPEASWHLSDRWGKKPYPKNLSRLGIEPGPAVLQARMLPPAPQRLTS